MLLAIIGGCIVYSIKHKDVSKVSVFFTCLALLSMVFAFYNIMTIGQVEIDSDTATATLLAREQIKTHSLFPNNWNYVNGDIWFISENLIDLFLTNTIHNQSVARCIQSVILLLITAGVCLYYSRHTMKNNMWALLVPVFFIGLRGMFSMILWSCGYVCAFIFIMLAIITGYELVKTKERFSKKFIWLIIFVAAVCVNGIRNIGEIVLPLMILIMFWYWFVSEDTICLSIREKCKKIVQRETIVLIGTIIGVGIYYYLSKHLIIIQTDNNALIFAASVGEIFYNIRLYVYNIFNIFGYVGSAGVISGDGLANLVGMTVCLVMCFICPILQAKKFKESDTVTKFSFVFCTAHNFIMFLTIVLLGKTEARYTLTSVMCLLLISANYIVHQISGDKTGTAKIFFCLAFTGFLFIDGYKAYADTVNWQAQLARTYSVINQLEERGLTHGYASYWNSYKYTLQSDFDLQISAVVMDESGIKPMYWLNSNDYYSTANYNSETFVMVTSVEKPIYENSPMSHNLKTKLVKEFALTDADYYIYVYSDNELFNTK